VLAVFALPARAQDVAAQDAQINTIRQLAVVRTNDQERIRTWIEDRVAELKAAPAPSRAGGLNATAFRGFRERIDQQLAEPNNTPAFATAFVEQLTAVAQAEFAKPDAGPTVLAALARVLVDADRAEIVPALVSGLTSPVETVRYLCARGLVAQAAAVAQDKARLASIAQAVQQAAVKETSAAVLGRLYEAIAIPSEAGAVFPAFTAIFDARLSALRAGAAKVDAAEVFAIEYFSATGVQAGLDANQKAELVRRLAVFLRIYAQRYNDPAIAPSADADAPDVGYYEREFVERSLYGIEGILEAVVGSGKGGKIRDVLGNTGFDGHADVLTETARWVGSADGAARGELNEAPWNVAPGAP
jgi:hypothetical protein